ncbi:hypothetical protein ACLOJK_032126 [Asimina triloba]
MDYTHFTFAFSVAMNNVRRVALELAADSSPGDGSAAELDSRLDDSLKSAVPASAGLVSVKAGRKMGRRSYVSEAAVGMKLNLPPSFLLLLRS